VVLRDGGHGWRRADWLINYQWGFVRRGLFGELVYRLREFVNPVYLVTVVQIGFQALVLILLFRSVHVFDGISLLLICSPLLLGFYFNAAGGSLRKELLAMLLYLVWLHIDLKGVVRRVAFLAALAAALLSHEVVIFILPYMLFNHWYAKQRGLPTDTGPLLVAVVVVMATCLGALLSFKPAPNVVAAICASYNFLHGEHWLCGGAIASLDMSVSAAMYDWSILTPEYRLYGVAWCVGWLPFWAAYRHGLIDRTLLIFTGCSVLWLLPLFLFGGDWGRWLHLAFFLNVVTFLKWRQPIRYDLPLWLVGFYCTVWGMKHVGLGLTPGLLFVFGDLAGRVGL